MVLFIAIIVCAIFANEAQAKSISYGAIGKGGIPCGGARKCQDKPENPYHRGCEKLAKCRSGGSP
ncbi:Protein RALF-like 28 [Linum perenne]